MTNLLKNSQTCTHMKKSSSAPCLVMLNCQSNDPVKSGNDLRCMTRRMSLENEEGCSNINNPTNVILGNSEITSSGARNKHIELPKSPTEGAEMLQYFNNAYRLYYIYSKMKKKEELHGQRYIVCLCIVDIALQDCNITNCILDSLDYVLSSKDLIESLAIAGINIRNFTKKRAVAVVKMVFVVYKLFIYKWFILSMVNDNSYLHVLIDYINMFIEHII